MTPRRRLFIPTDASAVMPARRLLSSENSMNRPNLFIALAVTNGARACPSVPVSVCNEMSLRCYEADFWCDCILVASTGEMQELQNGARDLENEVKVQRSRNFN